MKEIKAINQAEAIKNAFYASRFKEIDLWLFGLVSLVGCYQEDDQEHPFIYFWKIEDKEKKHQTVYVGVFEKEKSFTEHCYNREIRPGDIIFWEQDIYAYHQSFNKLELITPFGLINPEKLRQAFPPNHPLRDTCGELYEVFDENLKLAGIYWCFSTRYNEKWLPLLPQIYPDINDVEDVLVRSNSNQSFTLYAVHFQQIKNSLQVDVSNYRKLDKMMLDKLRSYSDEGQKWQITDGLNSFGNLSHEDIADIIKEIDSFYGTELQNEDSWIQPKDIVSALSFDLDKRIFV